MANPASGSHARPLSYFLRQRYQPWAIALVVALLALAAACGGGEPSGGGAPPPGGVIAKLVEASADVVVSAELASQRLLVEAVPSTLPLAPGETTVVTALAYDATGRQVQDATFRWTTLSPLAGAVSARGVFRSGLGKGTFTDALEVEARSPSVSGVARARVTVVILEAEASRRPSRIRVSPTRLEVDPGEVVQVVAFAEDGNGVILPGLRLEWSVADPSAGAVTPLGRFTGGQVAGAFPGGIRVKLAAPRNDEEAKISTAVDVSVRDETDRLRNVFAVILPQAALVRPNQEIAFTALALDGRGNNLKPSRTTWRLLDAAAGAIGANGRFRAGSKQGQYLDVLAVDMVLPSRGGFVQTRATASVTVAEASDILRLPFSSSKAVLFPERVELSQGESFAFSVVAIDQSGRRVRNPSVAWALASQVGKIAEDGRVTTTGAPGFYPNSLKATITLEGPEGQVTQELLASVTIRGPLARAEVNPLRAMVAPKGRVQFTATAYDANGVVLPDVTFRWRVADAKAGSISRDGLLRAGADVGEFLQAVRVQATQRPRR